MLEMIGFVGSLVYIASYILLQRQVLSATSMTYYVLNAVAAGMVMASLVTHFNLASLVIQVTWLGISVFGMMSAMKYVPARQVVRENPVHQ